MIRINLLRNRKNPGQGLPAALAPRGRSAFISSREVALAAVFLGLGGAILWFVLTRGGAPGGSGLAGKDSDSVVMAESGATPDPLLAVSPGAEIDVPEAAAPQQTATPVGESGTAVPELQVAVPSPVPAQRPSADSPSIAEVVSPQQLPVTPSPRSRQTKPGSAMESGSASILSHLSVTEESGALQIFASLDRTPQYQMFRAEHPNRVVIDFPDVRHTIPRDGRERSLSNPFVQTIRIAQYQLDPPKVRLVLDVESFPNVQILPQASGLAIRVSGGGQ